MYLAGIYPLDATQRMIDEQFGDELQCDICGIEAGACICPECPICTVQGDPRCIRDHGLVIPDAKDGTK